MCYSIEEHSDKCPITEIKFVNTDELVNYLDDPNYAFINLTERQILVFSKNVSDNLPITQTSVQKQPCLDPKQISDPGPNYLLEIENQ